MLWFQKLSWLFNICYYLKEVFFFLLLFFFVLNFCYAWWFYEFLPHLLHHYVDVQFILFELLLLDLGTLLREHIRNLLWLLREEAQLLVPVLVLLLHFNIFVEKDLLIIRGLLQLITNLIKFLIRYILLTCFIWRDY